MVLTATLTTTATDNEKDLNIENNNNVNDNDINNNNESNDNNIHHILSTCNKIRCLFFLFISNHLQRAWRGGFGVKIARALSNVNRLLFFLLFSNSILYLLPPTRKKSHLSIFAFRINRFWEKAFDLQTLIRKFVLKYFPRFWSPL